ncbi:MAG TPA: 2'-5' RNA ligase family protein [Vicinamibacterales bacterium]|nr:2'-5' RNA ligase family protein [Vicinamibacterales bacterium]
MLIALDVAILPPRHVSDRAIELSSTLPREESQGLLLGPDYLPHITLLQLFVSTDDLNVCLDRFSEVVALSEMRLRVTGGATGSHTVWMEIELTPALVQLHTRLLDTALPFERSGADATAFYDGDARDRDIGWVAGYRAISSGASFRPHITLGHATHPPVIEPFEFEATTLAACHLGRFCSCRRVLRAW